MDSSGLHVRHLPTRDLSSALSASLFASVVFAFFVPTVSVRLVARDGCSYSDKRIWKEKGADAIMHIRFLRICLLLCGMMALFGSAVIIPINIHGTSFGSHDTARMHEYFFVNGMAL